MIKRLIGSLAFVVGLLATTASATSIVYEQAPLALANQSPFTSQFFPACNCFGFNVFDNFILAGDASITRVGWSGIYFDSLDLTNNPPTPNALGFGIDFFTDNAGLPGTQIYSATFAPSAVNETATGNFSFTLTGTTVPSTLYSYVVDLPAVFAATAGTPYWMRIYESANFPAPGVAQWGWARGQPGDNRSLQYAPSGDLFSTSSIDRAFSLSEVPEPGTLLLLGSGLGALFLWHRRQLG